MEIRGRLKVDNSMEVSGSVNVVGTLYANAKSFQIVHPNEPDKKLTYGSLESPYHGIRITGQSEILNTEIKVELPSYTCKLVHYDNINIQVTNYKHDKVLFVKDINIPENYFIIAVNKNLFGKSLKFFWTFTAIRKDIPQIKNE